MVKIFIAKYGLCIYFVVTIHYNMFIKTLEAITKTKKRHQNSYYFSYMLLIYNNKWRTNNKFFKEKKQLQMLTIICTCPGTSKMKMSKKCFSSKW